MAQNDKLNRKTMSKDKNCTNCTNCAKATERRTATGHTGWRCVPNGMDVNARMHCEEWQKRTTATARPVYAVSPISI